jgi:adenylate kinase
MKIVLLAVPGGGKTTIMNFVKQKLPDVKIINYGDVMFEIAKQRFGIQHRDEMRKKIPVDEYRKIQEEAAEYIASLSGDVIIDTHASIRIMGGYYPGLPEFDPKNIIERRKKDPERSRDVETEEEIEMHQMANRYYAFAAANAGESAVHILSFRDKPESRPFEHAEIAAEYIVNLILKSRNLK